MTNHAVLTDVVAVGLLVIVASAALLLPYRTADVAELRLERVVLREIPAEYRPEEVDFAVRFKEVVTPYRVMGMFVMPGESVDIEVLLRDRLSRYTLEASAGAVMPRGTAEWIWQAPSEPGLCRLYVDEGPSGRTVVLNAFVKVPYDPDDLALNGYHIGRYEPTPLNGDPAYDPPRGFIEVTPENRETMVAPHFTIGQFLAKQESDYPKYLLLNEKLLLNLEQILKDINDDGIHARSLHVMSGFRTPYYNRLIGNSTSYSRHLYGDAADIFVDTNDDNYMDDLTADGIVTREDAIYMASIVEEQRANPRFTPLVGGIGVYSTAAHRGPFIHVDVRGTPVRW